jgi:hypothetical protein
MPSIKVQKQLASQQGVIYFAAQYRTREIVSPFTVTLAKPSIDSLYVLNLHQAQTRRKN